MPEVDGEVIVPNHCWCLGSVGWLLECEVEPGNIVCIRERQRAVAAMIEYLADEKKLE